MLYLIAQYQVQYLALIAGYNFDRILIVILIKLNILVGGVK